jgi:hypothetical protein
VHDIVASQLEQKVAPLVHSSTMSHHLKGAKINSIAWSHNSKYFLSLSRFRHDISYRGFRWPFDFEPVTKRDETAYLYKSKDYPHYVLPFLKII